MQRVQGSGLSREISKSCCIFPFYSTVHNVGTCSNLDAMKDQKMYSLCMTQNCKSSYCEGMGSMGTGDTGMYLLQRATCVLNQLCELVKIDSLNPSGINKFYQLCQITISSWEPGPLMIFQSGSLYFSHFGPCRTVLFQFVEPHSLLLKTSV